jgi:glutamyl-tRNA reductase
VTIILVGLNHETAPVELREQFYMTDYGLRLALESLCGGCGGLAESAIVSTCNRLEIYGVADDVQAGYGAMTDYLAQFHKVRSEQLASHLYLMEGRDAIEHLMRVASGLDSLVLGEPQILGQVSHALAQAQSAETCGPVLSHLLAQAVHAGKRARTETDISRYTVSVSHAAALLVKQEIGDLRNVRALVVGAGEMAELAARALQMHGAESITVISRTYAHAEALAKRLDVQAVEWSRLTKTLIESDVVITATAAPHSVIHMGEVSAALMERGGRGMLFVDVAVPRDVDEAVGDLPRVVLYDIDDLQLVVDGHRAQRQAAVKDVEQIIAEELDTFVKWLHSRQVVPVIVDLRQKAEAIAESEVEQALRRMPELDERDQAIIMQMAHRIVNKLLHEPTTVLKSHAAEETGLDYAQTLRELFALEAAAERQELESSVHG